MSSTTTIPSDELENRVRKIRLAMENEGIQCLLVHGSANYFDGNFRYITGIDSSLCNSIAVVTLDSDPVIVMDPIPYADFEFDDPQSWIKDVRKGRFALSSSYVNSPSISEHISTILKERGMSSSKVGLVSKSSFPASIVQDLNNGQNCFIFCFADSILLRLRSIKSSTEIEICRNAARIADEAMESALEMVNPNTSEIQIVAKAVSVLVENGATNLQLSHPTFCISGSDANYQHRYATERKLQSGDLVSIGIGCNYQGYQTYLSRTIAVGQPNSDQRKLLETALNIETAVIGMLQPGVVTKDVLQVQEGMLNEGGYGMKMHPFLGWGLGTDLLNLPMIVSGYLGEDESLEPGMILTVGPTIVADGIGKVCFQDALLINDNTHEELNKCRKKTWNA